MRLSTVRSRALTALGAAAVALLLILVLDVGAGGGDADAPPPARAPQPKVGVDHAHDGHTATPPLSDETRAANDAAVEDGTYDASGIVLGAAGAPARIRCLTHQRGAARPLSRIGLGVVHTTEGPNVLGLADVNGLCAWFRSQQLSATWIVDDEGNSAEVVPLGHAPWTQWKWNPWSCSIEFVGYAARLAGQWTQAQLREGARLMVQCFKAAGVPIRWGAVAGTAAGTAPRIVTTGVVSHAELGYNGGSHHDPGAAFPR
ncbi:MAG TPA: N-acetylmuramoyl-L-alanine amidase, partial [Solirubrobacteraceae bacterium]|nr:N-acetylmuramoyl-L-alanine amidase [Solirubrobacteraceae bacterium]